MLKTDTQQEIPAGLLDGNIEIFAHESNLSFTNAGKVRPIHRIKTFILQYFRNEMQASGKGFKILAKWYNGNSKKMLYQWIWYNYGGFTVGVDFNSETKETNREIWNCGYKTSCEGYGYICQKIKGCSGEAVTRREIAILQEISKGYPDKWIASNLLMKLNTLLVHKKNISRKICVHSKSEMVAFAVAKKLIHYDRNRET